MAVAEGARNVACVGARPRAITDCMNFGNPEHPEVMWQFSEAVDGISEATKARDCPVVSGNVSFYNTTDGNNIHPTPSSGLVGIADRCDHGVRSTFAEAGLEVAVLGSTSGEFGGSLYQKQALGRISGKPPAFRADAEQAIVNLLVDLVQDAVVVTAHDLSIGGLAMALVRSSIRQDQAVGGRYDLTSIHSDLGTALFAEDGARALVGVRSAEKSELEKRCASAGVPLYFIGTSGHGSLEIKGVRSLDLAALKHADQHGFERAVDL